MSSRTKSFLPLGLAITGLLLLATGAASVQTARAQSPVIRVEPATRTVDVDGGSFTVDIVIDNVTNLGAYEFELVFDPSVLRVVGVENGAFLGSSSRTVRCEEPELLSPPAGGPANKLRFACHTQNATPSGPNGSGVLATVTLAPKAAGSSPLTLIASTSRTGVAGVLGNNLNAGAESGSVTVVGEGEAATPSPDEPTPIPTEQEYIPSADRTPEPSVNDLFTPQPGETPMTRPIAASAQGNTNRSSNGATTGGSGSGNATTGAGSPRAGTGPEQETNWWPTAAGATLAVTGALLLSFSVYLQRVRVRRGE